MIRTKTTLVVGAAANGDLQMPDEAELLAKIVAAFDFHRLGTETQTRDTWQLAQHLDKMGRRIGKNHEQMFEAAGRIRTAARITPTIDAILEQFAQDEVVTAAAKLGLIHFALQNEAKSLLQAEPREPGELPFRGSDYWLFQLGRMVTTGVARNRAERCLDDLTIISFTYDRAVEHFLPFAFQLAFGMPLAEARALVAAKLNIHHPLGTPGRLPWQLGEGADVDWAVEVPWNILNLLPGITTASARMANRAYVSTLQSAVASARNLVFLGFTFDAAQLALLFDYSLSHDPDVLCAFPGLNGAGRATLHRLLKRKTGIENDDLITVADCRCLQLLRDYSLLFEG